MFCNKPIGIFDSGIGGLSVLTELRKLMPNENYIYYADIENAPYGEKSAEQILRCCSFIVKKLVEMDCKAVVIACNTATAVAVDELRNHSDIPIFGIEPAIKPAAEKGGNILVLTTDRTSKEERFLRLVRKQEERSGVKIYTASAQGLVSFVERGECESESEILYIKSVLNRFNGVKFDSCVLGCTHFPFAKSAIEKALGYQVEFFDGGSGTAKFVKSFLEINKMSNTREDIGEVVYIGYNSNK